VDILTDNRNRAASEVRFVFSKNGGSLGAAGCVAWMFSTRGTIVFNKDKVIEDDLMEVALEAGAEDVRDEGDQFEVITSPADFETVKAAFEQHQMEFELAEISKVPQMLSRSKMKNRPSNCSS